MMLICTWPSMDTTKSAIGHGIHYCVGAALARLEAHAILRALAARVSRLTLVDDAQRLNNITRGPASVQVRAA